MNVTFTIVEKTFKSSDGKDLKYYVLSRNLFDGSVLEIPVKDNKSNLTLSPLTGISRTLPSKRFLLKT